MITNITPHAAASAPMHATADIRDIKPPIPISDGFTWLWWVLATLIAAAILFFIFRRLKNRRSKIVLPPPVPAHVRAKKKLAEALALIANPKPFVIAVSDATRAYLEERFDFRAPERTTEEFLRELSATDLLVVEQKESLGQFLESCDLVKFAKYEPGENELRGLHDSALRLVKETESHEIENAESGIQEPELSAVIQKEKPKKATNGEKLAIIGVILQLGNAVFFFAYIVGLVRELNFLQELPSKVSQEMSREIKMGFDQFLSTMSQPPDWFGDLQNIWDGVLVVSGVGLLVGFIGLVMIFIALIKQRYRAEWFFWFLVIYSGILCAAFPVGTIFGIFFLVYCLTKRREFLNPK